MRRFAILILPLLVAFAGPVRAQELVRRMGYQFRLTQLTRQDKRLTLQGVNEGVAPFYYPWPVELTVLDAAGRVLKTKVLPVDIRTWLPGSFSLAVDLAGLPVDRDRLYQIANRHGLLGRQTGRKQRTTDNGPRTNPAQPRERSSVPWPTCRRNRRAARSTSLMNGRMCSRWAVFSVRS